MSEGIQQSAADSAGPAYLPTFILSKFGVATPDK
jgi:hypothetical protein